MPKAIHKPAPTIKQFEFKKLAALLNAMRLQNGYSLSRLQTLTGYTKGHLSYVLSGKRGMSLEFFVAVLEAMGYAIIIRPKKKGDL